MNWLAHVYLSEPDIEVRLGNLLADLVIGRDRAALPAGLQRGFRQHQAIDSFTDSHPRVYGSRSRIKTKERHVSGILIDVFYDHFLAMNWSDYCDKPLTQYTQQLYQEIQARAVLLPADAQFILDRIIEDDRLASYATLPGIEQTLWRLSQRIEERSGHNLALQAYVAELQAHYDELQWDFNEFFPQLQNRMRQWSLDNPNEASS